MQYEGEAPPTFEPQHSLAAQGWQMLGTAQRDIDWAGLPYAVELLRVPDVETFIRQLLTFKHYKPPE